MLATRRGEKKLTRKVMMLQTIEAEHSFKVKQSEWMGVWAEHNHRTRRRCTGLSWLEYTVVTRDLSVCLSVTVTNGNASRDSLRRASPLSNCWLVANVGIPVCSGTTPCEVRVTIVVIVELIVVIVEVIVGLSLRAEVGFTEPNFRYYQFSLDSLQRNVAIF